MSQPPVVQRALHVVIGPTAAGKSAVAMALAEHFNLAIVSADSRQLYRGFDIGTAKPTAADRARVRHFGIDVLEPVSRYSAHQWATDAASWMETARAEGREPLVVGGTGFYIRALSEPLSDAPALDTTRRDALGRHLATLDADTLAGWCARLDPARSTLGRTQQLRAVETALLSGVPLSTWHARSTPKPPAFAPIRYLVVDPGPSLAARIAARVQSMVAEGWVDEVRTLLATVPTDAPAWQASGYAAMVAHVRGTCTLSEAMERVTVETRQYAKRQRTWYRHQLPPASVTLLDSTQPDVLQQAHHWWESRDRSTS